MLSSYINLYSHYYAISTMPLSGNLQPSRSNYCYRSWPNASFCYSFPNSWFNRETTWRWTKHTLRKYKECGDTENTSTCCHREQVEHLIQAFSQRPQSQKKEIVGNHFGSRSTGIWMLRRSYNRGDDGKKLCFSIYLSWSQCWHL